MRSAPALVLIGAASSLLFVAGARGALPPFHGGILRVPAPSPVHTLDPTDLSTPFEASLSALVFETLYRIDDDGRTQPALAAALPEREGRTVRVPLRSGVMRHGGAPLTVDAVAASLRRASRTPSGRWLLAGLAYDGDRLAVTTGPSHLELTVDDPGVDVARRLAAAPLAIALGRNPTTRPVGTGPFAARSDGAGYRLREFRLAGAGAPRLAEIRIVDGGARDEALREFERGEVDLSFFGAGVYGGRDREVGEVTGPAVAPVLLIPNRRRGPLSDPGTWGRLARAVERGRLRRAGLDGSASLAAGLPAPAIPAASGRDRISVTLLVRAGDVFEERLAEALAGPLDEAGFTVRVDRVPVRRYTAAVTSRRHDLRLSTVPPPLPGAGAIAGAALHACGRSAEAQTLVRRGGLRNDAVAADAARSLPALVLGRFVEELHHQPELRDVGYDRLGRLRLDDVSIARDSERPR